MSERIAVTGANGFVGRALSRMAVARTMPVTGLVRANSRCEPGVRQLCIDSLQAVTPAIFAGCFATVHLAARVHVMHDSNDAAMLKAYRVANVEGTLAVAKAARAAGVKRFIYVSSIKALGDCDAGRPLQETDERRPANAYGVSKAEAELELLEFGERTGLEIVIVRPPLVYGPHVRANFLVLMNAINRGVPLPIGSITARRSLVYVDNLAHALLQCLTHWRAAGQIFHVTDGEDPTVAELARRIAWHLGKPAHLVPVPASWLRLVGRITGKLAQVERLTGSLQVNSDHIRDVLGWRPLASLEDGLKATAAWFRLR